MIILIHINLLLRFLIPLIVYTKRSIDDLNDEHDNETTDELEDMNKTKSTIKDLIERGVIGRVERGLPVSHKDFKDLEEIKKEYDSYFDEDSGNTVKEGMEEVAEYLNEEIASLSKNNSSEGSNAASENESKKRKVEESTENKSSSTESTSTSDDLPVEMPSIFDDVD